MTSAGYTCMYNITNIVEYYPKKLGTLRTQCTVSGITPRRGVYVRHRKPPTAQTIPRRRLTTYRTRSLTRCHSYTLRKTTETSMDFSFGPSKPRDGVYCCKYRTRTHAMKHQTVKAHMLPFWRNSGWYWRQIVPTIPLRCTFLHTRANKENVRTRQRVSAAEASREG